VGERVQGQRAFPALAQPTMRRLTIWHEMRRNIAAYLFLSPFFVIFSIFLLFPILFSFYISFFDWPGMGARTFIGLDNYRLLLNDPPFLTALRNTAFIGVAHVVSTVVIATILGVLLDSERIRFKQFWQPVVFIPSITATIALALVFQMLLGTQYGVINDGLAWLGVGRIPWLDQTGWARWSLVGVIDWRWTGYNAVIVLAGLKAINRDIYEAATVDGASWFRQLIDITVPLLRPILLFISITSTIGILQLFTEPFILTPDSAPTLGLYLYQTAFTYFQFGYGSAIAYFITGLAFVLALAQFKAFGRSVD